MQSSSLDVNLEQISNFTKLNITYINTRNNSSLTKNTDNNIRYKQNVSTTNPSLILHSNENDPDNESNALDRKLKKKNESKNKIKNQFDKEDYMTESMEKMQLNPSTDFYNDYDDDKLFEYEDVEAQNEAPEYLPEARSLVQEAHKVEEEDMGYDEDDERISVTVERTKDLARKHEDEEEFLNEEGGANYRQLSQNRYRNNNDQFRLNNLEKSRKNQQKFITENVNRDVVDTRESSGNFANDDEDDERNTDTDHNNYDDENSNEFFIPKSNGRYFRKNTNDAIKIISTPLGKVGIVYQPNEDINNVQEKTKQKPKETLTDFDALFPDPESSHRLGSSHPKITPVLTPDGKVALLYRGDSENSKYEPIRNLTHKFQTKNEEPNNYRSENLAQNNYFNSTYNEQTDGEFLDSESNDNSDQNIIKTDITDNTSFKSKDQELGSLPQFSDVVPTTGSFIIRPTDTVLPMINRPLSEVLGIKKNQFKQFRVKDIPSTTEQNTRSLAGIILDNSETTTLRFFTKVNLADYPTSGRTRNMDFDFSRDNTMLDERSRPTGQNQYSPNHNDPNNNEFNTNKFNEIANEDVLAKTEVVNLAIIPHFDEELERLQRLRERENRGHHRQRHRHKQSTDDLSGIHCIMQAMMGIAAISTVFGMLGTFFKQRILDQIRLMHW